MRLIVAGGRGFTDYFRLEKTLKHLLSKTDYETITLVCGEARGADSLGKRFAEENGIAVDSYVPDWNTHGKRSGILRNIEMAENATHLVAFFDGKSKGTGHMIGLAQKKGLLTKVYYY